jgi:hypothetical protein
MRKVQRIRRGIERDAWDRRFEADIKAGKLDSLAEQALKAHASRKTTSLFSRARKYIGAITSPLNARNTGRRAKATVRRIIAAKHRGSRAG